MDKDNASWAPEALCADTEAQTAVALAATASQYSTVTVADTPAFDNPNLDAAAPFFASTGTTTPPFVSQFRIDGQPILPPLMTDEKRRQMQELRKQAITVERKISNRLSATILDDASKTLPASDTDSSSSSTSKSRSSSGETATSQEISKMPRRSQLQQTQTFIYDSTQQQQPQQPQQQPQQRPQTLSIGANHVLLPTICVNPPTPLQQPPNPPPFPAICPTVDSICNRQLTSARRKLNKITSRIMHFEQTQFGGLLREQHGPIELLWQNQTLCTPLAEKRAMQRSSTSPALHAEHEQGQQMQRSRSFTLEQPSQALVDHMQRAANETATTTMATPSPQPPPLPPPPAGAALATLEAKTSSPRCHFNTSCSTSKSLSCLRRDTVESKAKQVQRVASCTSNTMTSRRSGGHTPGRLQQQQQQIRELLQRALHETADVMEEQDVEKRRQLTVAKQKMLEDIKSAHRDRFHQLVQYQLEEQRRMQAEFDRQQKLLIEQICADINVSSYALEQPLAADGELLTNGKSEYTSTDDLPSLSTKSESQSEEDLQLLQENESAASTSRKRLFEDVERKRVRGSHEPLADLSLESLPGSSSSPKSRVRKPAQRSVSKPPSKLASPPVTSRLSRPQTPASNANSTSKGAGNRTPQKSRRSSSPAKTGKQQPNVLNRQRQSVSPSRQTAMPEALMEQQQRRHDAATILTAATRGFLVRRLFRTEQVQRIVQTIRDTLIFVLNLHLETFGSGNMGQQQEEAANIRLKARLLQQLCSASRTLHLIFFQTSIRERMEIIARDRKRIKTKLLSIHVKQRQ